MLISINGWEDDVKNCLAKEMGKGEQTRRLIVGTALDMAAQVGLGGLTLGPLADTLRMSKSGVYGHFRSRDLLLAEVVRQYREDFEHHLLVKTPALLTAGDRLRALFVRWCERLVREGAGCLYLRGPMEAAALPPSVRDELLAMTHALHAPLRARIVECMDNGVLHADCHPDQLIFELSGLMASLHHQTHFLKRGVGVACAVQGYERLIASYRADAGAPAARTAIKLQAA